MPHAEPEARGPGPDIDQDAADELLIQQALDPQSGYDFERELEPGEKADDAVDYEDISDNDLADDDDEDDQQHQHTAAATQATRSEGDELFTLTNFGQPHDFPDLEGTVAVDDNLDDLFGDVPSSPTGLQIAGKSDDVALPFDFEGDQEIFGEPIGPVHDGDIPHLEQNAGNLPLSGLSDPSNGIGAGFTDDEPTDMELLQRRLFAMSNFPPAPPENQEELLQSLWPRFAPHTVPRFFDLIPKKTARYIGKTPLKLPKAVQPTKVNLELATDQEKSFRFSSGTAKRSLETVEELGLIPTQSLQAQQNRRDEEGMDEDSDFENEPVGGVSWNDFQVLCEDWNVSDELHDSSEVESSPSLIDDLFDGQSPKPSGVGKNGNGLSSPSRNVLDIPQFPLMALHDYDASTKRVARAVTLDLNDPHLLIDKSQATMDKMQKEKRLNKIQSGELSKRLARRYNISNDAAYDLLKENHQSKIRSTLGQPTLVHSGPARRLQYPYYKCKLLRHDARNWHRPIAEFRKNEPITFEAIDIRNQKRKHMKGRDPKTLFDQTTDLSLRDNAHVLLLEYSEEHPAVLSNFGMGSRVINYYRKTTIDDAERPKREIGELSVLLPQDKSPFWQFGHVDSGATVSTIHNALYKAPIFEQEAKKTDFLMTRTSTNTQGKHWYLKNIEHVRVVGQQFPSQEVPRPNGRKVSTAAKNRIKMVAYRLMRRKGDGRILIPEVTKHTAGDSDMQLRQKLKEFLQYNKDNKDWGMIDNRPIPDEETTRAALPPEDACLVESVQVGQQHLEDAGYAKQGEAELDDDAEEKEGQSVEEQLAPWHTTKNFLMATAGKAMLQLHGEGDPSGRGEAFSLLKTSMKGGFKAIGESVEDKISAKKRKELGGHSYNVAEQNRAYEQSIRKIWDAQYQSLSSIIEHSDTEMDMDDVDDRAESMPRGMTPRSEVQTPSAIRRRDDETMSEFSKFSTESRSGLVLKITRRVRNEHGILEDQVEEVRDPKVIRQYRKRKQLREVERIDFKKIKSSDVENNPMVRKQLESELNRLERNKDRRLTREKQKAGAAGSPGSPNSPAGGKPAGTQRKCANCGQAGHIKTNKKLCPLLNGTMKQEDGFGESSFSMTTPGM